MSAGGPRRATAGLHHRGRTARGAISSPVSGERASDSPLGLSAYCRLERSRVCAERGTERQSVPRRERAGVGGPGCRRTTCPCFRTATSCALCASRRLGVAARRLDPAGRLRGEGDVDPTGYLNQLEQLGFERLVLNERGFDDRSTAENHGTPIPEASERYRRKASFRSRAGQKDKASVGGRAALHQRELRAGA